MTEQSRDPNGIPSGGRFASTHRPAAAVALHPVPELSQASRVHAILDRSHQQVAQLGPEAVGAQRLRHVRRPRGGGLAVGSMAGVA